MFENLANGAALVINLWHAGFYMIHPILWQQAIEAWAADQVK